MTSRPHLACRAAAPPHALAGKGFSAIARKSISSIEGQNLFQSAANTPEKITMKMEILKANLFSDGMQGRTILYLKVSMMAKRIRAPTMASPI
jgi:hypothetical protein